MHLSFAQDGNHDLNGLRDAVAKAKSVTDQPSLIKVSTLIGYGSPNRAGTHDVHGAALGKDETAATREQLQWNYPPFEIPDEAYKALSHVEQVVADGQCSHAIAHGMCSQAELSSPQITISLRRANMCGVHVSHALRFCTQRCTPQQHHCSQQLDCFA